MPTKNIKNDCLNEVHAGGCMCSGLSTVRVICDPCGRIHNMHHRKLATWHRWATESSLRKFIFGAHAEGSLEFRIYNL
jgi:hypothetical protein